MSRENTPNSKRLKNLPEAHFSNQSSECQPKVFIKTFGCQMNVRDSEVICGLLGKAGYQIADEPQEADVLLFNTCSVRQHAEDKVWSEIGRFKKEHQSTRTPEHQKIIGVIAPPKSASTQICLHKSKRGESPANLSRRDTRPTKKIVGLVGCMAQNYKEKIFSRAPQVDFVAGPSDIDKIPEIIMKLSGERLAVSGRDVFEKKIWETDGSVRPDEIYRTGFYEDKKHAYVVISEGCSNFCTYCVVPYVRGTLRNRNYKDILREIEEAVDRGIKSITLLGQNVCAYGAETSNQKPVTRENIDFIRLLESVNQINGLKEFSFITSHPRDTSLDLFRAMAGLDKLKKYLHLPLQSGSDRILKLMRRGYTRKFYLDLARNYRKIVKGGVLTTDIIVGFPTESEEDFKDTCALQKEIKFDSAYIFKYSLRENTAAADMPDDVPKKEKERRHRLILDLQKEISRGKKC